MAPPFLPPDADRATLFAAGACPTCLEGGELLVLRRPRDGKLLFHCRSCGLAFTHEEPGIDPEAGETLRAVAGDGEGVEVATLEEIRAAGLEPHARPARMGGLPWLPEASPPGPASPKARIHREAVAATRKTRKAKPKEKVGVVMTLAGLGGVGVLIKIALAVIKALSDR